MHQTFSHVFQRYSQLFPTRAELVEDRLPTVRETGPRTGQGLFGLRVFLQEPARGPSPWRIVGESPVLDENVFDTLYIYRAILVRIVIVRMPAHNDQIRPNIEV